MILFIMKHRLSLKLDSHLLCVVFCLLRYRKHTVIGSFNRNVRDINVKDRVVTGNNELLTCYFADSKTNALT